MIELLVVIAIIAILAAMLLPALSRAKQEALRIQCMSNAKQMALAFNNYPLDNTEFYPPNPDDGNTTAGHNWVGGQAGVGGGNEFDPDILRDATRCLLAPYIGLNVGVFQCPSDQRYGTYDGTVPGSPLIGKRIKAARSVSMNQAVGTICPAFAGCSGHAGRPNQPVNGHWLVDSGGCGANNLYATFGKTSDFRTIGSSLVFLTLDENPWSINDGGFAVSISTPTWIDYPSTFHNKGCGFSFCDGHGETHHWKGVSMVKNGPIGGATPVTASDPDWLWVSQHASARK